MMYTNRMEEPTKQPIPEQSTVVVPTVEQPQSVPANPSGNSSSPILLVLQWLTYAFWGWFLLACAWNIALVVGMLVANDTEVSAIIPYSLASLFVLLPIAAITDFVYHRREPQQKSGGASAIMAIHAVLFALCTIGIFVFAIFTIIQLMTAVSASENDSIMTALITSFIMTALYVVTFIRVVNPFKTRQIGRIYTIAMVVVGLVIGVSAVVGPLASSLSSRDDRAITESLSSIGSAVDRYVSKQKKLPTSLGELELIPAAKSVVDKGLVTIEKLGSTPKDELDYFSSNRKQLSYQLCATYTTKKEGLRPDYYNYDDTSNTEDSLYVDAHEKGRVCYNQTATYSAPVNDTTPTKLEKMTFDTNNT